MPIKYRLETPKNDFSLLISATLLVLLGIMLGPKEIMISFLNADFSLLATAGIIILFATLIDYYRNYALVKEGAQNTVEYMQDSFQPISLGVGNMFMNMILPFKSMSTKALGKGIIMITKIIEFIVKSMGAVIAILALIGFFLNVQPGIFIGLWVILSTIIVTIIIKASNVISVITSFLSFAPIALDFKQFSTRTKTLIGVVATAGIASWALYATALWLGLIALGQDVSLLYLFFAYALATSMAILPFSLSGLGLIEVVGVLFLNALGVQGSAVLISFLVWETMKMIGDNLWLRFFYKPKLVEYV